MTFQAPVLAALALSAALAQCTPAPPLKPPTVSLSACASSNRPSVSWYVAGQGQEIWLTIDPVPVQVATVADRGPHAGSLDGYYNKDGRTVDVRVTVDGRTEVRTLWATKAC